MENRELKPCPFCGKEPRIETGRAFCGKTYWVICANWEHCPAYYLRSKSMFSKKEAIEVWNRRAENGT